VGTIIMAGDDANSEVERSITQELIDFVDLDVAYSPVIVMPGEREHQAVEVYPSTKKGYYIVNHPLFGGAVTGGTLKVMRLRYILETKKNQSMNFRMP